MEAKVTLWREVEAGTRFTAKTAMERYPQLDKNSFKNLPSEVAQQPKSGNQAARDVKTYLATDVDALVARLAAPEPVDPRWREVEAGTRFTAKKALERFPQLAERSLRGLPSELARKPKSGPGPDFSRDVKTYLAADVDALVARLAAPEPEPVDPRWREVEARTRYTLKTAMERYPQLTKDSCTDLPSKVARQPKQSDHGNSRAHNVKTYLAIDIDKLAARLATPDPEPVDRLWLEVESGARYDQKTAMARYPQLNFFSFEGLPSEVARRPKIGDGRGERARDVKTYLAADIERLVASHAPEPVDPRWLEVESGARYDARTAMKRYPQLTKDFCKGLPFEIARRPKGSGYQGACDVKTYAAADVDELAAARANKRARVQEPEPPQEPEPEPEEEPEECPVCLDPMTGATATLVCGHLFCKDCITDWARSQTTCPTCRATLEIA